jgi:hypothetical protein
MNNFYSGVLNTGRRRYAHPALSGSLPIPWLPAIKRDRVFGDGAKERRGVVLSLRRKMGKKLKRKDSGLGNGAGNGSIPDGWMTGDGLEPGDGSMGAGNRERGRGFSSTQLANDPWRDPMPTPTTSASMNPVDRMRRQTSYDPVSGIIALPDEHIWDDDEEDDDEDDEEDEVKRRTSRGSPVSLYSEH